MRSIPAAAIIRTVRFRRGTHGIGQAAQIAMDLARMVCRTAAAGRAVEEAMPDRAGPAAPSKVAARHRSIGTPSHSGAPAPFRISRGTPLVDQTRCLLVVAGNLDLPGTRKTVACGRDLKRSSSARRHMRFRKTCVCLLRTAQFHVARALILSDNLRLLVVVSSVVAACRMQPTSQKQENGGDGRGGCCQTPRSPRLRDLGAGLASFDSDCSQSGRRRSPHRERAMRWPDQASSAAAAAAGKCRDGYAML